MSNKSKSSTSSSKSNMAMSSSKTKIVGNIGSAAGGLGSCSVDYARSLGNPFTGPENACIPDYPALMTGRYRTWIKGTFATSTNGAAAGFGYIVADPFGAVFSDTPGLMTNAAAGTEVAISMNGTAYTSNSTYTSAQLPNIQYRIVSAGLRIRYTGSELVRGGQVVGLHQPAHVALLNYNIANMDAFKESERLPVTRREWTTLLYRPVDTVDLNFKNTAPAALPITALTDEWYMGFCIQAADTSGANPQAFEFEFFVNVEIQGAVVLNKMPSHVDTAGHGAVNAITNMAPTLHKPHQKDSDDVASGLVSASAHYLHMHTSDPSIKPKQTVKDGDSSWWQKLLGLAPTIISTVASLL